MVGTTHECEPLSTGRVECTANLLRPGLSASEIDSEVARQLKSDAHTIYRLDSDAVRELAPTLVVTQALCAVCAVPESTVRAAVCTMGDCRVVSADPHTLEELFGVVQSVADAARRHAAGARLVRHLRARLDALKLLSLGHGNASKSGVMVLEWPDPPYAPGHWVWEMVDSAGGDCVLGSQGVPSRRVAWDELHGIKAEHVAQGKKLYVVAAFCGYDLAENECEVDKICDREDWAKLTDDTEHVEVYATNATAYFSRPGPRLIDGCGLLAYILHRASQYRPSPGSASVLRQGQWLDLSKLK